MVTGGTIVVKAPCTLHRATSSSLLALLSRGEHRSFAVWGGLRATVAFKDN